MPAVVRIGHNFASGEGDGVGGVTVGSGRVVGDDAAICADGDAVPSECAVTLGVGAGAAPASGAHAAMTKSAIASSAGRTERA
jgi:hypothetical protein